MSKRRNDKLKNLLLKKGFTLNNNDGKREHGKQKSLAFETNIAGKKMPVRWGKARKQADLPLYQWKKQKQGVIIKRKTYKVFDAQ